MSTYIPILPIRTRCQCGSDDVFLMPTLDKKSRHFVFCNDCGFEGPEAATTQAAVSLWNNPPVTQPVKHYKDY
ncbi:hypothetical protein [Vibrio cortegadensis]|uniref:hypothetical protein n=1 Tax=Vibrio cortegadensis TaxID=1328770 RepID=UPI00352F962B